MVTAEAPTHVWEPNPRQREVLQFIAGIPRGEYGFVGYGGAAGGAKTNLLAEGALEVALGCPGSRQLIGRHTMKDLKSTTLAEFDERCPPAVLYRSYDSGPVYRDVRLPSWPTGVYSRIYFREVKDARNGIGSEQYSWVWLEEAHEIDKVDILYLFSRLRHKPEKKWGIVCAFNPFPSFVVDVFIEGTDSFEVDGVIHQKYVPARVRDNPHLPPNYEAMMRAAYSNDPFMLAVLLEGNAGVVPNAVFPSMKDPEIISILRCPDGLPRDWHYTATGEGYDWGTSIQHQSAIVCASREKAGLIVFRDAFMSPEGSSDQLYDIGQQFKDAYGANFAAYDRSQGSLDDDLRTKSASYLATYPEATKGLFHDVRKGVRDVDGRIRVFRGLIAQKRVRFDWTKPGVRQLWNQFAQYHRDDDGAIVEVRDDLVDAALYVVWELENGTNEPAPPMMSHATSISYGPPSQGSRSLAPSKPPVMYGGMGNLQR